MSTVVQYLTSIKDVALTFGEVMGALLIGISIGVVGAIRKRNIKFKWNAPKEQVFVEKHSRIHELLTELRVTVRASRCMVFQFHNGGSFADGTSIKRFSVTHESCGGGVTSMILESQDVLLTRYVDLVRIMEETPSKILPVSSISPSSFRSGLEINSVEYFSITPLKGLDNLTPLGFVCCHWCSVDELDQIESEGIEQATLEQLIDQSVNGINSHFSYKAGKR